MSKKNELKPHYILYIDLLGTKNNLTKDKENEYIEKIKAIYNETNQRLKLIYKEVYKNIKIKFKIFSDNVVFAIEKFDKEEELQKSFKQDIIIELATYFQLLALEKEILTRGAITIGPFIMDKLMISGSGLVRAYELESKVAIFPRIIIDNEIAMHFIVSNYISKCINRDNDGIFYINIFQEMYNNVNSSKIVNSIKNIWSNCIYNTPFLNFNSVIGKPKVHKTDYNKLQKIYWLITQYNSFCKNNDAAIKLPIDTQNEFNILCMEGNYYVWKI